MSRAVDLWDAFVARCCQLSAELDSGVGGLRPDTMASKESRARLQSLAYQAFCIAGQSLLLGVEEIGKLALACERCLDLMGASALVPEHALPILASSTYTLRRAFDSLAAADRSGARADARPLEAARYELETLFPLPGQESGRGPGAPDVPLSALTRPRDRDADASRALPEPGRATPRAMSGATTDATPDATPDATTDQVGTVWVPSVADDMVELFFEEAGDRIEDLSLKLIDVEQRPGDPEILRDVFRDLHTLKGSSAMVGLQVMNSLAHAAEDLVGQLREGHRQVDGAIIDALLAALDGLRDIVALAKNRRALDLDLAPIVKRLRDPHAALQRSAAPDPDSHGDEPGPGQGRASQAAGDAASPSHAPAARQTIRVDFDKLDRLMNLVGELVLGRDGLRSAIVALSGMADELSSDRLLTRRLSGARRSVEHHQGRHQGRHEERKTGRKAAGVHRSLEDLGEELGRIERVLLDIAQELDRATGRLDSVSDDLRDQVMKLRMVPVGGVFRKHHRTVRDLSTALGKRVRLELAGEDTELDKLLVEALDEPLMHLMRNAVDHGIEPPEARIAAQKSAEGVIRLSASHRGNQMVVEIADDGKGIDPHALRARARERGLLGPEEIDSLDDRQILDVIFRPGFSTAVTVSQVSGRGVGMDVVREAIVAQLKGTIDIDSTRGEGTTFTLRLPLTLAIIQVLLARAGGEVFAIPLDNVVRTLSCPPEDIHLIQDREVMAVRGKQVPLVRLSQVLELDADPYGLHAAGEVVQVVLIELSGESFGLVCDHLLGKKEIVIKSLGDLLHDVPCAAGATLLGDRCVLILDVLAVIQRALRQGGGAPVSAQRRARPRPPGSEHPGHAAPRILLVEDSDTIRESLRRLLAEAGYDVTVAVDGVEGLSAASRERFDLVSTDVMMPRMDGYELTRALRAMPAYHDAPIVMVTSRGERIDRVRGFDAGVDEYITKPHDRQLLLKAVRKLLAERGYGTPAGPPDPHDPHDPPGRAPGQFPGPPSRRSP